MDSDTYYYYYVPVSAILAGAVLLLRICICCCNSCPDESSSEQCPSTIKTKQVQPAPPANIQSIKKTIPANAAIATSTVHPGVAVEVTQHDAEAWVVMDIQEAQVVTRPPVPSAPQLPTENG